MAEKTTIKIFIASAGELADERQKSILVLTQLNKSFKHLHLEPVLWEIDMVKGNYPNAKSIQDAINPKLKESQVIVFIFYTRLGVNTLIEFELANSEKKKMLVFFREGFSPKKEQLKTYGELLDFQENMDSMLRMSYNDLDKFETLFYTNLNLYLSETYPVKELLIPSETATLPSSIQKVIQDLTEKDKRIKELEGQLALKSSQKADNELQKLIAEKEALHNELLKSEEIIKQQEKIKEELESQLALQKDSDDFKAKALLAVEEKDYDAAENYLKESAKGSFSDAASTLYELAKVKKLQFQYGEALNYYEMAIRLNPENSLYLNEGGIIADYLGIYNKAIGFYEKSLVIDKKIHGEEHPDIATRYNNLGMVYNNKGAYDKAIELYNMALKIYKKSFGEENTNVAAEYNNLGLAYHGKGEYDKAIELYHKAQAIDKKFHGDESPEIAIQYNNLGMAYDQKGEHDKAIEFFEKALIIDKKFYGNEHPEIGKRYNNLGSCYDNKGEYNKAIELYETALEIDKKFYGNEHPSIAIRYNNLGLAYNNKGEYDKAIGFYEKALTIGKKFYGDEHPVIATGHNNLGLAYYNKREYEKAINFYNQSLLILKKFLPEKHPNILTCQNSLALAQSFLDKQKKEKFKK